MANSLNKITTKSILDATVATADIAADAVTGAKIADNAIDSEHYVDGSIDHVHLANDAVDGDNIADDAINSEHYVDGSIDTAHIADNQVTLAKMAGLARGKIIYGDSSGDPAALTVGSSGTYLTSDGTDISWGSVTSFVTGMIILWSGNVANIPSGWVLCNGSNSTPDLRDKFVIGAKEDDSSVAKTNVTGSLTQSGGSANVSIATTNLPSHTHGSGNYSTSNTGSHNHSTYVYAFNNSGDWNAQQRQSNSNQQTGSSTSSNGAHSHSLSGSSGSTGDGNALAVLNPYYALAYIMKS